MQIKRSVLLFPLLCVGCGGGGQPEATDYFHEDTFAVVHINSSALQESSLWEELIEREFKDAWEEMNEGMKETFGFTPDVVESATFAFSATRASRDVDAWNFVSTDQALELDKLGEASERRVADITVYHFQYGGGTCELEDGLYVFADNMDGLTEMLSDEADERELDEDVRALFEQADWSADLMVAISLDEMPRKGIDEIESALVGELGISERDARAVRDVSGVLVSLRMGSDEIELVCELICEDSDATEDVLELVEDLLGAIEDEREIPGDLRDLIEDIEVDTSGETIELTLVIDQKTIEDLLELIASEF